MAFNFLWVKKCSKTIKEDVMQFMKDFHANSKLGEKKPDMQIAAPCEEPPSSMYMDGYVAQLDQLSRIRRMKNVDLIQSRCIRLNFRDTYEDNYYMYGPHGLPPASSSIPPGSPPPPPPPRYMQRRPPPPPRYMMQGPPAPPPGPPPPPSPPPEFHYYQSEPPLGPPPGYPPCGFFSDENPNGCTVM
ncbi:hypothetical protein F0562_013662 [Nyssa sinensis]|uniref:Uncharacterized protein n=1 Tax=Nyssa sinensis TaxID=561372 RepID=A0A5J4ZNW6_9ASTE|nr:hypothetical protein F0562_013662 [Nyssa sinensis]